MYFNGDGILRDFVKAYVWNSIAADKRFKDAAAKRMTPEQITKAQELVKEMVKKNPKGCIISEGCESFIHPDGMGHMSLNIFSGSFHHDRQGYTCTS